jgi:hypothetical protein
MTRTMIRIVTQHNGRAFGDKRQCCSHRVTLRDTE